MKTTSHFRLVVVGLLCSLLGLSSCMTTYDHAGRPVQSVDPGVAVAGVAAAGLIGYAAANNRSHDHHYYRGGYGPRRHYSRGYYRSGYYR